jgi:hypothetical protein
MSNAQAYRSRFGAARGSQRARPEEKCGIPERHIVRRNPGRLVLSNLKPNLKTKGSSRVRGRMPHTFTLVMIPFGKISSGLACRLAMPCS